MNDLFSYPDSPGFKEATTSAEAAASMEKAAPVLRDKCRRALLFGPATADEVATRLGLSVLAVRPRFTELQRFGVIAETGERRPNESGRSAKVWKLAA